MANFSKSPFPGETGETGKERAVRNPDILKYKEASAGSERTKPMGSENPTAHFVLGKIKKNAGNPLEAIVELSKAIRLKEDFTEALMLRAEALMDTGDYKDGLEDIGKVLNLSPDDGRAYLVRGMLQEAAGNQEAAEKDYRYVTELNPSDEEAYLRLGNIYISRNRPLEAIGLFNEAIELKPDSAKAYSGRARARLMTGDKNGFMEDIKKAMELNPGDEMLRNISGTYSNSKDVL